MVFFFLFPVCVCVHQFQVQRLPWIYYPFFIWCFFCFPPVCVRALMYIQPMLCYLFCFGFGVASLLFCSVCAGSRPKVNTLLFKIKNSYQHVIFASCVIHQPLACTDVLPCLWINITPNTYGRCQLDCECNWVKSIHDVYENTWECGELELYPSPSAGG